jgi:hypothetical protein
MKACEAAIDRLQEIFDIDRISEGLNSTFTTWPVLVPTDYMDLLMEGGPETLLILAHYAVVLYNLRGDWCIEKGSKHLINMISHHHGSYSDDWMSWPNSVFL